MRELTFEEMEQVGGGNILFELVKFVVYNLIWENKQNIWDFLVANTTQALINQQAHYDALYECYVINNSESYDGSHAFYVS